MRSLGKFVLTLGAVALLAAPALAQRPGGGGGFGLGGGGGPFILMAPNVQKALKLTDDQTGKVAETVREVFGKYRDEMAALRDLDPQERMTKQRSLMKSINDDVKKELALTADQSKRFDQISLQHRGLDVFADPAVQDKLKLTDEQKQKIRAIGQASRERAETIREGAESDRQEAMRKLAEMRKENMSKAMALLTDDQKQSWKGLTGDPVEIQLPQRGND